MSCDSALEDAVRMFAYTNKNYLICVHSRACVHHVRRHPMNQIENRLDIPVNTLNHNIGDKLSGRDVAGDDVTGSRVAADDVIGENVTGSLVAGDDVMDSGVAGVDVAGSCVTGEDVLLVMLPATMSRVTDKGGKPIQK